MMYLPSPLADTLVIPSVCPTRIPDGFGDAPNERLSLLDGIRRWTVTRIDQLTRL